LIFTPILDAIELMIMPKYIYHWLCRLLSQDLRLDIEQTMVN
jgi:hypothetical protein